MPAALLNTLFSVPEVYTQQAAVIEKGDVRFVNFNEVAEDAVRSIEFDVDVKGDAFEENSGWEVNASISPRSAKATSNLVQDLGTAHCDTQKSVMAELQNSIIARLTDVLGPLDTTGLAPLREDLSVCAGWLDAISRVGAKHLLMDYPLNHEVSDAWWGWLLSERYLSLDDGRNEESALSLLSRRYLSPSMEPYPPQYAKEWLDLSLEPKVWKTHPSVHALWLASMLKDPGQRLAKELDAQGFKFKMKNVDWTVAINHATGRRSDEALLAKEVEPFLVEHFQDLINLDHAYATMPFEEVPYKISAFWNARNLMPRSKLGFVGLLANVLTDHVQEDLLTQIEAARIAGATQKISSASNQKNRTYRL